MRLIFKTLYRLVALGLFCSPFILAMLAIERYPLVDANREAQFDDIAQAKHILKRLDPRLMDANTTTKVSITDAEISLAMGAVLSRLKFVKGRVDALADGVWLRGTAELPIPDTFLGRYINVEAVVAPSVSELVVSRLSVGAIGIPAWIVKPATIYVLDTFMGRGKGAPAYASVRGVAINNNVITVAFRPPPNLFADVKAAAGRAIHLGNAKAVRAYYRKLMDVSAADRSLRPVSLARYVGPLFALAKRRSESANPVDENRALILALAMYFGDSRFELLLRNVKTPDMQGEAFDAEEVKLERRHDWAQHFTTTAGLQVAAGSGISNFIGQAKEISDSEGPSGFSFTDIAADRTGVRFAEIATGSAASARAVQNALADGAVERDFFPKVGDLPEGLSEAAFKAAYGDINTETYNAMIRAIDRRIEKIELYK